MRRRLKWEAKSLRTFVVDVKGRWIGRRGAAGKQAVKPLQLFQCVIHTLGRCEECRGWEAVKLARQSGASRLAKKPPASRGNQDRGGATAILYPLPFNSLSRRRKELSPQGGGSNRLSTRGA